MAVGQRLDLVLRPLSLPLLMRASGRLGLLKRPCFLGRPGTESGPTGRAWAVGQAWWTGAAWAGGPSCSTVPCPTGPGRAARMVIFMQERMFSNHLHFCLLGRVYTLNEFL